MTLIKELEQLGFRQNTGYNGGNFWSHTKVNCHIHYWSDKCWACAFMNTKNRVQDFVVYSQEALLAELIACMLTGDLPSLYDETM